MLARSKQIVEAIEAAIADSGLPAELRTRVVRQKVPAVRMSELTGEPFPLLLLSLVSDEAEGGTGGGTNLRDDATYSAEVRLIAEDGPEPSTAWDDLITWRETLRKQFHHRTEPFETLTEFVRCEVAAGPVFDRAQWLNSRLLISLLTIRVTLRESRSAG